MKAGWDTKRLVDVATVSAGNPAPQDKALFDGGIYPFFRTSDVGRVRIGRLSDSEDRLNTKGIQKLKLHKAGTILLPKSGASTYLDHRVVMEVDGYVSSHLATVFPNTKVVEGQFLFYALLTVTARELSADSSYPTLSLKQVQDIEICLPPLDEQRRIVAVLDKAFAGIATATANAQKNLTNARALFESALASIFADPGADWIVEPIAKNVRFIDYRGKTPPKRDAGIRLITAKNVKMGFVRRTPEEFIDPAAYDEWMTRGFPKRGDVLFTTEAPLGNVAQLDTDEKVVIGQRLITMQAAPQKIDNSFLKYMLCSAPLQEAIHAHATGATVLGIKAKLLKTIPIFYPKTIQEQLQIVARLDRLYDEVEALAKIYQSKLAALTELKQSLLHKAFAGELT